MSIYVCMWHVARLAGTLLLLVMPARAFPPNVGYDNYVLFCSIVGVSL